MTSNKVRIYAIGAAFCLHVFASARADAANTPPAISEPQTTDAVPSTFTVVVEPGTYDYCDTDGCSQNVPEQIRVEADEVNAGSESPENGEDVMIEVTLEPGMHTLVAKSEPLLGPIQSSSAVTVLVESTPAAETGTDTATEGTSGTTEGGPTTAGPTGGEDGCACSSVDAPASAWWAICGVGALIARRRRSASSSR